MVTFLEDDTFCSEYWRNSFFQPTFFIMLYVTFILARPILNWSHFVRNFMKIQTQVNVSEFSFFSSKSETMIWKIYKIKAGRLNFKQYALKVLSFLINLPILRFSIIKAD